jgi:hypothetical protein
MLLISSFLCCGFWWGPCYLSLVFCVVVFGGVRVTYLFSFLYYVVLCFLFVFVFVLSSSCVPNIASVSGLFILDCPFGFR